MYIYLLEFPKYIEHIRVNSKRKEVTSHINYVMFQSEQLFGMK